MTTTYHGQTREQIIDHARSIGLDLPSSTSKKDAYQAVLRYLRDRLDAGDALPADDATAAAVADVVASEAFDDAPAGRMLGAPVGPTVDAPDPTVDLAPPTVPTTVANVDPDKMAEAQIVVDAWRSADLDDPDPGDVVRASGFDPVRWSTILTMADALARSALVPVALRRKPEDVAVILLAGSDLGLSPTMALSKIHVVDGKPTLSAEVMVALVLRDGHRLWGEATETAATVHAARRERPEEVTSYTFTIDDAARAGLDRKDVWKRYPKSMLWARAVSQAARMVFPDVLAGLTYTPEEVEFDAGGADPTATTHDTDPPIDEPTRGALRERIDMLPPVVRSALADEWRRLTQARALRPLGRLRVSEVVVADGLVARYEARAASAPIDVASSDAPRVVGVSVGEAAEALIDALGAEPVPSEPVPAREEALPGLPSRCSSCGRLDFHVPDCPQRPF